MGRHQHDIDELKWFERLCLELAAGATMPEERAGLETHGEQLPSAILDAQTHNGFADIVQTRGFFRQLPFVAKLLIARWGSNPGPCGQKSCAQLEFLSKLHVEQQTAPRAK
ncbi:hypothetical protein [Bradyrhizobium sp. RDM4]|uniref:hypothetical protein n=1 Tax=Bradyrhizobium sp. RDM4 TaxID=3378765 RepID=UPI0038FCDEBB